MAEMFIAHQFAHAEPLVIFDTLEEAKSFVEMAAQYRLDEAGRSNDPINLRWKDLGHGRLIARLPDVPTERAVSWIITPAHAPNRP